MGSKIACDAQESLSGIRLPSGRRTRHDEKIMSLNIENYIEVICPWHELFEAFLQEHQQEMPDILKALKGTGTKRELDAVSCEYIDRFVFNLELFKYKDDILVKKSSAYAPYDLIALKREAEFKEQNPDFPYADVSRYLPFVFANQYGLCDLPQQAFAYIDGKDIIDGGGYIGDSALLFEQMFKDSTIHVFEPLAQNYAVLQETLERYGKTGSVIPRQEGLAEHGGELELLVHGDKPDGGASFATGNSMVTITSTQRCKVISIDELCQNEGFNIGLIKLDVEGLESAVIRGA